MICPNCGTEIDNNVEICNNCGVDLTNKKLKKSKRIKIAISVVISSVIILIVAFAIVFNLRLNNEITEETTISTTQNTYNSTIYQSDYQSQTTEADNQISKENLRIEEQTISNEAYISDKSIELYVEGSTHWKNVALCNMKNIYAEVEWEIGNSLIASIVSNGNIVDVYAESPGETVLTCRCAGKVFTCKVIVYASYYDLEDDDYYYNDGYYDDYYEDIYDDNENNYQNNNNSDNQQLADKYMQQINELNETIRREERQLSILQMDTSGKNASKIAAQNSKLEKLYKQREDLYQKYYDALY